VRGWSEPDTRRPIRVSVHDEVFDGLGLSPATTRAAEEETVEMEDEAHGEIARIILEQVVEGVSIPRQLLLAAHAEPLVGAADDSLGSCLLDHDPLDGRRGDD
jgi:hypothetical protein